MSISVDDLVASLNANHIGQEAIELAALQAQLSQTLFSQSMSSSMAFSTPRNGPSNTPMSRTPSTSISLDPSEALWVRNGSTSSARMRCSIDESQPEMDETDEDERMVEDILLASPTSPTSPPAPFSRPPHSSGAPQPSSSAFRPRNTSLSVHMKPLEHAHHDLPSPNTSLFTTTDPFYLASLQSAHPASSSVFAQAGRPAAHSPFVKHPHHHHHHHMQYSAFGHGFQAVAPDVHAQPHHNMFAATATASAFSL